MTNRDRTDRFPRWDAVPEEGTERPRRDRQIPGVTRGASPPAEPQHGVGRVVGNANQGDRDRYLDERPQPASNQRPTRRFAEPTSRGSVPSEEAVRNTGVPPSPARARARDAALQDQPTEEGLVGRPQSGDHQRWEADDTVPDADEDFPASLPPPRQRARRPATGSRARAGSRPMPSMPRLRVPPSIAKADLVNDQFALALIGVAAFGLLMMATIMGNRLDALPAAVALRFDAVGTPYRWGVPSTLWNLPLMTTMITLMNVTVAWFVSPHDRFASRFAIAVALIIQLLVWVPVIRFLW